MPYSLELDAELAAAGWKVKIHDFERLEPPHITIYRKMHRWRFSLRDRSFLDRGAAWSEIDAGVRQAVDDNWSTLVIAWDTLHPANPVSGQDDA